MAATLTRGITIGATDQVTNTKLHNLVDLGTIANIDQTNIVSGSGLAIRSTSAPSSTNAVWVDTTYTPPIMKVYNGTSWAPLVSGPVTLTDGATPALDASLGKTFILTAAGNRTIGIPTNPSDRQCIIIIHVASGGARTLAFNTGTGGFNYGTDYPAVIATGSGLTDYFFACYNATQNKWNLLGQVQGF